jgi:3-hydroxyacyl-CoA dehydrogenase / enoyl-CoA hydratase / 3-hydroxybutyryl-CoA epimerase
VDVTAAASRHWRRSLDADGVCWLTLDKAKTSANTLSRDVLEELDALLTELRASPPRGLVIKSGKAGGFILGADIKEFRQLSGAAEGAALAARGQQLLEKIASLDAPTVAAIDGFALGGGLELALACHYRVAVESYERNLGLPEVQLGIHPGFGGTVRSVGLLGPVRALDLMLTGRSVSPIEADAIGLVDRLAPRESLDETARSLIRERPPRRRPALHHRLLNLYPVRRLLASTLRARVARRARPEHYPAPYALIDLWQHHVDDPRRMLEEEAKSVASLITRDTSANLVRVFFLQERLKSLGRSHDLSFRKIHVIGAGTMGNGIAHLFAQHGHTVTMIDVSESALEAAKRTIAANLDRQVKKGVLGEGERDEALERISASTDLAAAGDAGLVVEAASEDAAVKFRLFAELDRMVDQGTILATNTSSISITEIGSQTGRPDRVIGMHFMNPVPVMKLVEVIRGLNTSDETAQRVIRIAESLGKTVAEANDYPGFVSNRILMPMINEAVFCLMEGVAERDAIDTVMRLGMNHPMGPLALADLIGLDTCLAIMEVLHAGLGDDKYRPCPLLRKYVAAGKLGRKSGEGFYRYGD